MIKLTRISDGKLPIGWRYDDFYSPTKDTGLCLYRHFTKGVVIVQYDFTGSTEKLSVNSGITEFKDLKTHLITVNVKEANEIALTIMES